MTIMLGNSTVGSGVVAQDRRIRATGRDEGAAPSGVQLVLALLRGRRSEASADRAPLSAGSARPARRQLSAGSSVLGNICGCAYC